MGEIIRTLSDADKPLCPHSGGLPPHPAHQMHNRTLDAFYNAVEKNAEGEMPEPAEKAYYAAAYEVISDRMDLFHEGVRFMHQGGLVSVESWYWKCRVCGCILPAQAAKGLG